MPACMHLCTCLHIIYIYIHICTCMDTSRMHGIKPEINLKEPPTHLEGYESTIQNHKYPMRVHFEGYECIIQNHPTKFLTLKATSCSSKRAFCSLSSSTALVFSHKSRNSSCCFCTCARKKLVSSFCRSNVHQIVCICSRICVLSFRKHVRAYSGSRLYA